MKEGEGDLDLGGAKGSESKCGFRATMTASVI